MPSLVEIGQVVSEEDFLNFVNRILLFHNYLPLEKDLALHVNKLESPLSKDALCQVWWKLHGPMVLKMKIFKEEMPCLAILALYILRKTSKLK